MSGPVPVMMGTRPRSFQRIEPSPSTQRSEPVTGSPFTRVFARHTKPRCWESALPETAELQRDSLEGLGTHHGIPLMCSET